MHVQGRGVEHVEAALGSLLHHHLPKVHVQLSPWRRPQRGAQAAWRPWVRAEENAWQQPCLPLQAQGGAHHAHVHGDGVQRQVAHLARHSEQQLGMQAVGERWQWCTQAAAGTNTHPKLSYWLLSAVGEAAISYLCFYILNAKAAGPLQPLQQVLASLGNRLSSGTHKPITGAPASVCLG